MKENSTRKINDLVNYKNIKIIQDKNYFNFSLDSVLLPSFVTLNPNTKENIDIRIHITSSPVVAYPYSFNTPVIDITKNIQINANGNITKILTKPTSILFIAFFFLSSASLIDKDLRNTFTKDK